MEACVPDILFGVASDKSDLVIEHDSCDKVVQVYSQRLYDSYARCVVKALCEFCL